MIDIDLSDYGITGSNDTAAFQEALSVAAGRRIYIPGGLTVRLTAPITISGDVSLYGKGKIEIAFPGIGLTSSFGDVSSEGLTWDGTGQAKTALYVSNAKVCRLVRSTFQNFDSDTYVQAVTIIDADRLDVDACEFQDLTVLSDGTQGNTNGSVRGLYISGAVRFGVVQNCLFHNINNRDAASNKTWEDADAIQTAPGVGKHQNIEFQRNRFEDCGKRALKLVGRADSVYRIDRNEVASSWTGTPDDVAAVGNGMFYVFEAFGGTITCTHNKLTGGVALGLLALSTPAVQAAHIEGNVFAPEFHRYVNTIESRAFTGSGTLGATCPVTVASNRVANVWTACDRLGNFQTVTSNDFTTYGYLINDSGTHPIYEGNRLTLEVSGIATTTANAINIKPGVSSFVASNNVIKGGFLDGINIAAQSAAFSGVVVGNTIGAVTRNAISNFAGAAFEKYVVIESNKTDNASNPLQSDASSYKWHVNGAKIGSLTWAGLDVVIPGHTAATLANAASSVNTTFKRAGQLVRDTTNQRLMVSSGSLTSSSWWVVDGSASVTPT